MLTVGDPARGDARAGPGELWRERGAWLLQGAGECELSPCAGERLQIALLAIGLSAAIAAVLCMFALFRDEEADAGITPLCPKMVADGGDLEFQLAPAAAGSFAVVAGGAPRFQAVVDYPSAEARPGVSSVAATVRLQDLNETTLATVVARPVPGVGHALALFRGNEVFGFVEPESPNVYHVRHRTGPRLLTLSGKFDDLDVDGVNPMGLKVCSFVRVGAECRGLVLQHVDAGLAISSLLAAHVHGQLQARATLSRGDPNEGSPA